MVSDQDDAVAAVARIPTGGFDQLIGLELLTISGDEVTATLEVTPQLLQPFGLLHGGVVCSIVESTGSVGAATWFGDRGQVVGVSNHTDFLRAVRVGAQLRVRGTPIHRGRTSQLWLIEVHDDGARLVGRGQLRVANIEDPSHLGGGPRP